MPLKTSVASAEVNPTSASKKLTLLVVVFQFINTMSSCKCSKGYPRRNRLTDNSRTIGKLAAPHIVVIRVPSLKSNRLSQRILLLGASGRGTRRKTEVENLTWTDLKPALVKRLRAVEEILLRSVETNRGDLLVEP